MAKYQPARIFDAPDILFTQALQGEMTWRTTMNTLLRPQSLSIEERDSFADDIKEALGDHSVTNAMVGVMKNPFFWLLFVTSPTAWPALKAGKKVLFDRGAMLGAYMKANPPLLGQLEALTGLEYFSGTTLGTVIGNLSKSLDKWQRTIAEHLSTPAHDLMVRHKLTRGLDPASYPAGSQKAEVAEKLQMSLFGALTRVHEGGAVKVAEGSDQLLVLKFSQKRGVPPVSEKTFEGALQGKEAQEAVRTYQEAMAAKVEPPFYIMALPLKKGVVPIKVKSHNVEGWGGDDPFQVLRSLDPEGGAGLRLFQAYDEMRKLYLSEMFLKPLARGTAQQAKNLKGELINEADYIMDGVEYVVDADKVMRMWRASKNPLMNRKAVTGGADELDPQSARGLQLLQNLMSKDVAEAMWVGMSRNAAGLEKWAVSHDGFYEMVRTVMRETLDHTRYLPRNVMDVLDSAGSKLTTEYMRTLREGPQIFSSARSIPRGSFDVYWHPDDLRRYAKAMNIPEEGGSVLWETIRKNEARMQGRIRPEVESAGFSVTHRIDPIKAMERYAKDMSESHTLFIAPVAEDVLQHQGTLFSQLPKGHVGAKTFHGPTLGGATPWPVGMPFRDAAKFEADEAAGALLAGKPPPLSRTPMGGWSNADALWADFNLMSHAHGRRMMTDVILPTTLGRLTSAQVTGYVTAATAQNAAKWLRTTPVRKWMEESGDWGKNFMAKVDKIADTPLDELSHSRGIANWLYVTHLGANMSSVMLNIMQPLLLLGPEIGMKNLAYGYKKAFQEMGTYIKLRRQLPMRISDYQKEELIRKSFKWSNYKGEDLLDIHPNIYHTVDAIAEGKMSYLPPSWGKYLGMDMPMKLFEKAEWINRLVASHATENMMRTSGMADEALIARNVRDFVRQTQYGAHVMNTPLMLLPHRPPGGGGRSRWFMSDPTFRQFLTFPMRTATAFAYVPSLLAAPGASAVGRVLATNARAFGYGAVTYEAMKAATGGDVSRGLYPQAAFDIIQGDRFVQGEDTAFPFQLPPVIDITSGFASWVLGGAGDTDLLSRWVSRVAPLGVAGRRLASLVPSPSQDHMLGRFVRNMQGFYVGWDEPRYDGLVPVYKSDGTLVSYQKPTTMLMRALGADMRKFATEAQMDRWLATNRDESSRTKREFMTAVLNSDWSHADELNARYKKKYGIPIRLSRQQLSSQMRTRTLTRTERLLDRMSPDLRERYIQAIQHKAPQLGMTQEQLGQSTGTQRTQAGAHRPAPLSPEAQRYLEAYMAEDPSGVFRRFGSEG